MKIMVSQLDACIKDYDRLKGDLRKKYPNIIGDQGDIVKLKRLFSTLSNTSPDRELYPEDYFQLLRIVIEANTNPGSESHKIFDGLKNSFDAKILDSMTVLHEHDRTEHTFTYPNYEKLLKAQTESKDIVHLAEITVALIKLERVRVFSEQRVKLRTNVEAHAAPIALVNALDMVAQPDHKEFYSEETIQKVLSAHDPYKTAEEITKPEMGQGYTSGVAAGLSSIYNRGIAMIWSPAPNAPQKSTSGTAPAATDVGDTSGLKM